MKEVQNKNHTDEAKRLNEELDQNLKDLQPESKEAFQGFEVKEEKNEKKKKAKKKKTPKQIIKRVIIVLAVIILFVKELEAEADFVIIDTPPSGLLSDAAIVAQYVDGAVFVIRQDYTDVDRILEGMEILSGSGAEITGCILNDVNVRTSESQHYMNSYRTKGETL